MKESVELLKTEEKYVLIFDICSSTKIVECLTQKNHQESWRDLIIEIGKFLIEEKETLGFDIYKFLGDGWILLFKSDFNPKAFFPFIGKLELKYADEYNKKIEKKLDIEIDKVGIKFGFETGLLDGFLMLEHPEYVGMPLIMAERLQGAIEDRDEHPEGKLLMSWSVYNKIKDDIPEDHRFWTVPREIEDIMGGEKYYYVKYEKRLK